ncbi:MAG: hypothetical protein Q7S33_04175 [Nanoarchaeota archaeon]|nr:hypothetical protein [Nanoarchaeota archaeon]
MASITFAVDEELNKEIKKFLWLNLSALVKQELLRRQKLLEKLKEKLNSEEEQELVRWSVELGRKTKKESFKKLLSKLPPKRREELLNSMSPEKKEEYK